MNQKIVLITYIEKDPKSPDYKAKMVSHGENLNTGQTVILPNQPLVCFDYHFDKNLGDYVLD